MLRNLDFQIQIFCLRLNFAANIYFARVTKRPDSKIIILKKAKKTKNKPAAWRWIKS